MLKHDGGFRWQFFTWFQLAKQDALGQCIDHALGEVGGASTEGGSTFNGHCYKSTGLSWRELNTPPGEGLRLIQKTLNLYDNQS